MSLLVQSLNNGFGTVLLLKVQEDSPVVQVNEVVEEQLSLYPLKILHQVLKQQLNVGSSEVSYRHFIALRLQLTTEQVCVQLIQVVLFHHLLDVFVEFFYFLLTHPAPQN